MAITLQAQVLMRGDVTLMNTLTQWAKRAGETAPAMIAISELMEEKERALFDSEGQSGKHGRWPEDKQSTKDTKARHEGAEETLQDSRALVNSLTDSGDPNAVRGVYHGMLRFGTRLSYAPILAGGTSKMVPRRPIDFTQKDRAEFLEIISAWIRGREAAGKSFRIPIIPSIRILR